MSDDADLLTAISRETFDHDSKAHGLGESGGPPGYDSIVWQKKIIGKALYFKIIHAGEVVGGLILFHKNRNQMEVGRIFVLPSVQNIGVGQAVFERLEELYPRIERWTLDTPSFSGRNQHFYQKLGYCIVRKSFENPEDTFPHLYFEKRIL